MADFNIPHFYLTPALGWRRWNFAQAFGVSKTESMGYRMALLASSQV